eukprot:TRINITY_DN69352_c0_g1_i1.p1 TRINITY_DN69352_c0_g1~~TRINITY_DN69352_c0_g1_i1.p1  ORF type:complete len:171 (-),score=16.32 TRINITY_DN69352_c0_g1_i1:228-740(-)
MLKFLFVFAFICGVCSENVPFAGTSFHLRFNGTCTGQLGAPNRQCKLTATTESDLTFIGPKKGVYSQHNTVALGSTADLLLRPVAKGHTVVEHGTLTVANNTLLFSGSGFHIDPRFPAPATWTRAIIGYNVTGGTGVWQGASGGITGNVVVDRIDGGGILYEMLGWVYVQ